MKKILLIVLLCLNIQLTYGIDYSTCGNRYGGYNSVPTEQTYRRIGYTTQYGGGFSNAKSTYYYPSNSWHNTRQNFSKPFYDNYHYNTIYPGNTYDNYQSNHNSRGSGPRRVIIRSDGDSIDTGSQDDYDPDWKYYHGVLLGGWYYDDGDKFWRWNGSDWVETWGTVEWFSKPADASPSTPIGDGLVPLSLLCLGYVLYRRRSNFFM